MAKTALVIVESPTKARTIEKFLGKDFNVKASYGHVRDLPNNASEIPEKVKGEKWARIGVNIEKDFEPLYIIPPGKKKHVKELKDALKGAAELLLATDEDREGESISWHLLEVLKPKIPVKRLVFHEITKEAIQHSLDTARDVNQNLVRAQETRRIVDRLYGYTVSPLLWRKMAPRLSAGRVQSVAMKILVERELERIKFKRAVYWDLKGVFRKESAKNAAGEFEAVLTHVDGKRVATGKDFEPYTGKLRNPEGVAFLDKEAAEKLKSSLLKNGAEVVNVEEKPYTTKPAAPFVTSTLQQEANRKLSFSARRTMQVAQMLYENGLITYMRTDSTTLSDEAINMSRALIEREYGKDYLPEKPRTYQTKVKNAQEAHEAIRPAGTEFVHPSEVKAKFGIEAFKLYDLIWKRTVASQMKDARGTRIAIELKCQNARFRAAGKTIEFPGFLRAYVEGSDDPEADLADQEKTLPKVKKGEKLEIKSLEALEHETQPPARFTEGSLIKELERLGIGRPSTWATIVDVILARGYAFKRGNALVPTFLARALTNLMQHHFTKLMDYKFTAQLEDDLDAIARGEADSLAYLKKFYFGNSHPGLEQLVERGIEEIDPREVCGVPIGKTEDGKLIEVRIGRYGPFVTDGENRASLPDMVAPDEMTVEYARELLETAARGPESLGNDPATGKPVYLKTGRFGPYVQLGDVEEGGPKPKMVSLLPGMEPADVNFEIALKLLELPKVIGKNPENGEDITVANGRYGPYLKCGDETRSIPTDEISPLEITVEQALELLKQPRRGRRAAQPKKLKVIGKHPVSEEEITLRSGRYGPYVTDGKINASVPKGVDPESVTIDMAVNLLEARAARIAAKEGGKSSAKKAKAKTKSKSKSKSKTKSKSKAKSKTKSKAKAKTSK